MGCGSLPVDAGPTLADAQSPVQLIDEKLGKELGLAKGEARKKHADDLVLLGRLSVPSDVAKLVSFLASADSEYITGKCMIVDGGVSFA